MQSNLYRWVKGPGLTPRLLGNVGDRQDFAEDAAMVTNFADGSKISFE